MFSVNLCPTYMFEVVIINFGLEPGSLLAGWDDYLGYFDYERGVGAVHKWSIHVEKIYTVIETPWSQNPFIISNSTEWAGVDTTVISNFIHYGVSLSSCK